MKRGQRLCILPAQLAHVSSIRYVQRSLCLFCTMLSDIMYEQVCLCQCSLKLTVRNITSHEFLGFFTVLRALV
jgi:hypothetical protein